MLIKIFTIANPNNFIETMNALALSFKELGYKAEVVSESSQMFGDINIVITGHRNIKYPLPKESINILFQVEELWNRRVIGIYDKSCGWDIVLELYKENCKIPIGTKNVRYFPMGYSDAFGEIKKTNETINGFFFGSMTDRRKEWLHYIREKKLNIGFSQGLWGKKRDYSIYNSKININIKAHELWSYAPIRALLVQCKGKFFICEKVPEYFPYEAEKHFIDFYDKEDFIDKFNYYITYEKHRNDFALTAREDLKQNHSMTKYLYEALKDIL